MGDPLPGVLCLISVQMSPPQRCLPDTPNQTHSPVTVATSQGLSHHQSYVKPRSSLSCLLGPVSADWRVGPSDRTLPGWLPAARRPCRERACVQWNKCPRAVPVAGHAGQGAGGGGHSSNSRLGCPGALSAPTEELGWQKRGPVPVSTVRRAPGSRGWQRPAKALPSTLGTV